MPDPLDPFAAHLQRAQDLFQAGEVVAAGQIWQAVLRKDPTHAGARACLIHVKNWLDERQKAGVPVALPPPSQAPVELSSIPTSGPMVALAPAPSPAPAPAPLAAPAPPPPSPPALAPEPAPPPPPQAEVEPRASVRDKAEELDIDQLLRQGCTLYDMDQIEDAMARWEQILEVEPHHPLALEYVASGRQELARRAVQASPLPPPPPPPQPPQPPQELALGDTGGEDILEARLFSLLQEGLERFDHGDITAAKVKWREMLALDPDNEDAKAYLSMADRDSGALAAHEDPNHSSGTGTYHISQLGAKPMNAEALEQKCRQGERLMRLKRLEQAIFNFELVLAHDPGHLRASRGIEQAKALLAEQPPEAPSEPPATVTPPASITAPGAPVRSGPALPESVSGITRDYPWLKSPMVLGGAAGLLVLGVAGYFYLHQVQMDRKLSADRESFAAEALAQVSHGNQPVDILETPAAIRREAEQAIGDDPVRAYHRAKELLRLDPSDASAAQLLDRARLALTEGQTKQAFLADFQKHIQQGDLESAEQDMDGLLRATPDDPALIQKASRLYLVLAQLQASKERWSDAQDALQKGRALNPTDHAWQGRLKLLEKIPAQPKPERPGWIAFLG